MGRPARRGGRPLRAGARRAGGGRRRPMRRRARRPDLARVRIAGCRPPPRRPSPAARERVKRGGPAPGCEHRGRPARRTCQPWRGGAGCASRRDRRRSRPPRGGERAARRSSASRRRRVHGRRCRPSPRRAWPAPAGSTLRRGGRRRRRGSGAFRGRAPGVRVELGRGRISRAGRRVRRAPAGRARRQGAGPGGRRRAPCGGVGAHVRPVRGPAAQERQGAPQVGAPRRRLLLPRLRRRPARLRRGHRRVRGRGRGARASRSCTSPSTRRPSSVDAARARAASRTCWRLAPVVLGVRPDHVFAKTRRRDKGGGQYRDAGRRPYVTWTDEDGYLFEVDLSGYLDTGLFLDHRLTRELVGATRARASASSTCSPTRAAATVHAAGGRRGGDHHGGSLADLPGLGAAQHGAQRLRQARSTPSSARDVMAWITETPPQARCATTWSSWTRPRSRTRRPWASARGTCSATTWSCSSACRAF